MGTYWDDVYGTNTTRTQRSTSTRAPSRTTPVPSARQQQGRPWNESQMGNPAVYGGRPRGPGVTTDPRNPGGLAPLDMTRASEAELEAYVRTNYGFMGGFLNIPEVRTVLLNAARQSWDPGRIQGALYATNWWKTTSSSQRQWAQLVSEDPASAQESIRQQSAIVHDRARTLGLNLPANQINGIARMVIENGWTAEEYIDNLIGQVNWSTLEGGELTASRDRVQAIAGQYLIDVSTDTAQNYAARIAAGELTEDGVRSIMQQQAKGRFGWMSDQIDAGVTVSDYLAPVRDTIARELEMAPDEINLMDPQWLSLVETRDDKGQLRAATLNEAMLSARKKPQYAGTRGAQEMATSMMSQLGQIFGRS